jgi:hypothetical protein
MFPQPLKIPFSTRSWRLSNPKGKDCKRVEFFRRTASALYFPYGAPWRRNWCVVAAMPLLEPKKPGGILLPRASPDRQAINDATEP